MFNYFSFSFQEYCAVFNDPNLTLQAERVYLSKILTEQDPGFVRRLFIALSRAPSRADGRENIFRFVCIFLSRDVLFKYQQAVVLFCWNWNFGITKFKVEFK